MDFDRQFKGLFVPEALLAYEPFVLGLSTKSRIPTVLILDAPWVKRYGNAGWLYGLESTQVFSRGDLVPAVAEAFSVKLTQRRGQKELVAVPTSIKGNILFYRQDLLQRYRLPPPRDWQELKAICRKILPLEKSLKYGLIFHATNFGNDFYPLLWGFGGQILDEQGHLVLGQEKNLNAAIAALSEICSMQGSLAPGPKELNRFELPGALRYTFYRGEALFMINWNTRIQDLKKMIRQSEYASSKSLTNIDQVGVAPIPSQPGNAHRYSNIGSFGWGINVSAIAKTNYQVMTNAKKFINLVTEEEFQLLAAEDMGQVPTLRHVMDKVTNKEVLQVYRDIFASPDVILEPRPYSRRLNNILEKYLQEAIYGKLSPEAAIKGAAQELKALGTID